VSAGYQTAEEEAMPAEAPVPAKAAPAAGDSDTAAVPPPVGRGRNGRTGRSSTGVGRGPRRRRRWFIATVVLLLLVVMALGGFAWYNSTVYYVGEHDGKVALYRGLPVEVIGVELSRLVRERPVAYDTLGRSLQALVNAHDLRSKGEAELFLDGL
jgi:hypothetical protein